MRSASNARTSVTYCKPSSSGIKWSKPLSVGSLIQPSIGIALSVVDGQSVPASADPHGRGRLTFMEDVAHGTVINNHDPAEIGLYLGQIFDVSPVTERAVLSIVPSCKVLALGFQPVNDRIGVLLYRSCKDDQVVPFTHLWRVGLAGHSPVGCVLRYLFEKFVTMGPLVNIVQDGNLGSYYLATSTNGLLQLHFDHMSRCVAPALGHAVD